MAKTTKKRANAKGAAKKAVPVKAKAKKKLAKKGLRATPKGKQRIEGSPRPMFEAQGVGRTTLDLREERLTVEEHFEADQARAVPKKKSFRFRDAITGLFVRARDALLRKNTTVRERVK